MKRILLVDDEVEMLESINKILSHRKDFIITALSNPKEALNLLKLKNFDVIITDLKMGEVSGIDLLKAALKKDINSFVIIISGYGTIESSVEAVKLGAFDFIEKPFTSNKLFETIDRALNQKNEISPAIDDDEAFKGITYRSGSMKTVLDLVKKIAPGDMNILIVGESGTGKELIARLIHGLSKGKSNPFVPVNCGALPENLFESELFGHEKGAFTGAVKTKPGLLEFAKDGTFFFDEIGDMSQSLQVKLLRMLEERKIRRVGGQAEIEINVRIIAATNKNLEELVSRSLFREDLFYRLNTFRIELPPIRERQEDIIPLANIFMAALCEKQGARIRRFSPEAEAALKNYSWPGNVRELQNVINRAFFLGSSEIILDSDLPIPIFKKKNVWIEDLVSLPYKEAKESIVEKFEIEYLTYHLKENNGNISKTAERCGIDRRSIHRLLSKYEIIYKD